MLFSLTLDHSLWIRHVTEAELAERQKASSDLATRIRSHVTTILSPDRPARQTATHQVDRSTPSIPREQITAKIVCRGSVMHAPLLNVHLGPK